MTGLANVAKEYYDANNMLKDNIEDISLFYDASHKIINIKQSNDGNELHNFMIKYNSINNKKFNQAIANIFMHGCSPYNLFDTTLMKILINDYGFDLDDKFMRDRCLSFELFMLFNEYFDLTKYIDVVRSVFKFQCEFNQWENIKKIIEMGYNVNDISINPEPNTNIFQHSSIWYIIYYRQYHIMEYLLDRGYNFKIFEMEIMRMCIANLDYMMVTLFINYGASIKSLDKFKNKPSQNLINIYQLLESNGMDALKIINLLIYFRGNE